jgi:hypothetical protein
MFEVGQKVRAKIDMTNDLREDGMGVEHCASKGDELIVRRVTDYGSFAVSHEHITDRAFIATADELEAVAVSSLADAVRAARGGDAPVPKRGFA